MSFWPCTGCGVDTRDCICATTPPTAIPRTSYADRSIADAHASGDHSRCAPWRLCQGGRGW